jgi:hypothetical protein
MRVQAVRALAAAAAAGLLLAAGAARAEMPLNCGAGTLKKLAVTAGGARLTIAGTLAPGPGFDPAAGGLTVELAYEPETDPANTFWHVMLPAEGFQARARGWDYRDRAGTVDGVRRVKLRERKNGELRFAIKRNGEPLGENLEAGRIRAAAAAGACAPQGCASAPVRLLGVRLAVAAGACARTCASLCAPLGNGSLRCRRSADRTLCGVMSGCEPLGIAADGTTRNCMLPYPSSAFTTADPAQPTGRRIDYRLYAMGANATGVHVDPTPYNRLDGFSPGTIAIAHFAQGVDLAASNVPSPLAFAASLDPASPTLLVEADSPGCARVEHFGENDVSTDAKGVPLAPPDQVFMIRPGRRLRNATRYIVALRNLVGQDGEPIAAGPAFAALRDGTRSRAAAVEARRPAMDAILDKLETDCGVARADLVLAWDFTTASDDSIQRYLLHMRDQTFAALPGTAAPPFEVTSEEDDPFPGDTRVCRRVTGTYEVPLWTTFNGPGSVLNLDPATNLPVQNGVATDVPFTVMIPCSLMEPTPTPGRAIFYGHGLLGSGFGEVTASNLRTLADTYGFVIAATDWQGFSSADVGTIVGFINDLSGFPKLSERLHQGVLNQLVLARLLRSPDGFASHDAFQFDGTPIIDTSDVFYYGNSQGGIEGGVVMALSQDATRGVLGVAAANYSTLLHRSVDFAPFFTILKAAYPDPVTRAVGLPVIQQLWDRSEPNGWYHTTLGGDLPDTPAHRILVHMARADDEVANLGTEIMARSMGLPQVAPAAHSYVGIPELMAPLDSGLVESDFGIGDPPITNVPPAENSVHGQMRALPAIQQQIDGFLRTGGTVENFCDGPCDPE